MIWYVARCNGVIVSAHAEPQPGYAEEALDDANNAEMAAYRSTVTAAPVVTVAQRLAQIGIAMGDLKKALS